MRSTSSQATWNFLFVHPGVAEGEEERPFDGIGDLQHLAEFFFAVDGRGLLEDLPGLDLRQFQAVYGLDQGRKILPQE